MKRYILILLFIGTGLAITNAQNTLQGITKDMETNKAIEGVHVFIPELQKGTITNVDGTFELNNLPEGSFKVQFSHIGYKNIIRNVTIASDTVNQMQILLDPTVIRSETVVISAGNYSTQHDNAIKIEMLQTRDMEGLSAPSLSGKLTRIPGVSMISKGTGVTKPVIRGLSNSNILVLNNGVKLENFQFSENHPFMVDEFGTDRVEVIKGPASLLYGSDAVGGIINIIREKPAPDNTLEADFTQKYHSNTNGYVTNLGVKGTHDDYFWGVRGGLKNHADYISGADEIVPNTQFQNRSVHAFTGLNKPVGSFKLYYDYYQKNLGMSIPGLDTLVNGQDRSNNMWYQDLGNHMILSKNTFYLDPFKVETDVSFQNNRRQLITMDQTAVDMRLNTLSYEVKAHYDFAGYSGVIFGLQGANKENENFDAPNHVLPDHTVNDLGIFGLLQYNFSRKLKTQAGFRWDHRNILIPEQPASGHSHDEGGGSHEDHLERLDKNFGDFSASLGATYRLSETVLFRGNLASGYRTPNIAELTQEGVHGNRYEEGNRDLKSQTNYEADLSFHYHCCHALLDISGFYNNITNYIYLAPTGEQTAEGFDLYRYTQDNARLYGGEARFEFRPVEWFDLKLSYSKNIGKQENGQNLPFIPQDKLRGSIRLERENWLVFRKPFVDFGVDYAFRQQHPSRFETPTDEYFLVDIQIGGRSTLLSQQVSYGITLDNLFDVKYIDHLSTLKNLNYYNMGRNVVFWLKIPFLANL